MKVKAVNCELWTKIARKHLELRLSSENPTAALQSVVTTLRLDRKLHGTRGFMEDEKPALIIKER